MHRFISLALILSLAACGGRSRETHQSTTSPTATPNRANFGDAHPQDFGSTAPQDHRIHGIDVSKFQTAVDW